MTVTVAVAVMLEVAVVVVVVVGMMLATNAQPLEGGGDAAVWDTAQSRRTSAGFRRLHARLTKSAALKLACMVHSTTTIALVPRTRQQQQAATVNSGKWVHCCCTRIGQAAGLRKVAA